MSARTLVVFLGVLALLGLLTYGLVTRGETAIAVGAEMPALELSELEGEGTGSLADYRGQWVLVNVWASWCGPCRDESPDLQRFHERYEGDGFTVLGIDSREISDEGRAFVEEYGLTYPQLHDGEGRVPDEYGMTGFPESYLVDPDGKLALHFAGPVTEQMLTEQVAPKIEEAS